MYDFPLRRTRELKCHDLGVNDEILVMDVAADRAHFFNSSMTTVWNLCDGAHSADQIARRLAETFADSEAEDLGRTVGEALETLGRLDLLNAAGRGQESRAPSRSNYGRHPLAVSESAGSSMFRVRRPGP